MIKIKALTLFITLMLLTSCNANKFINESNSLLLNSKGWSSHTLGKGLTHYEFKSNYMEEFKSNQNINVLAVDLNKSDYKINFYSLDKSDSVSSVASKIPQAIAAVNGTYYEKKGNGGRSTSYLAVNKKLVDSVQVSPGTLFSWKHEGAFYIKDNKAEIIRGNNKIYSALQADNIMSGSPLLIENYHLSGTHFVRELVEDLNKLNYEDPDRHQGVRHPRTAIAKMENGVVLFVVVDGRSEKAEGMSSKELTLFLKKYFNPKDALNIDGGGSSTFWCKGDNRSATNVINYPTDNKKWDHYGQRKVRNGFIITKVK